MLTLHQGLRCLLCKGKPGKHWGERPVTQVPIAAQTEAIEELKMRLFSCSSSEVRKLTSQRSEKLTGNTLKGQGRIRLRAPKHQI